MKSRIAGFVSIIVLAVCFICARPLDSKKENSTVNTQSRVEYVVLSGRYLFQGVSRQKLWKISRNFMASKKEISTFQA
jgi:hypothetical protein